MFEDILPYFLGKPFKNNYSQAPTTKIPIQYVCGEVLAAACVKAPPRWIWDGIRTTACKYQETWQITGLLALCQQYPDYNILNSQDNIYDNQNIKSRHELAIDINLYIKCRSRTHALSEWQA